MAIYYFDTSALLKRYVAEDGSSWVRATIQTPEADVIVSRLTIVEAIAALARRAKGRELQPADATRVIQQVEADFRDRFLVIEVQPVVIDTAIRLAKERALRGYDALQLATALTVRSLVGPEPVAFVAADKELNTAATLEGLTALNPTAM